eukprot:m.23788 g.23788  ORF g.23788 m.23788 type:complete len:198 (+) comp5586_c0_seq1:45-638(+)
MSKGEEHSKTGDEGNVPVVDDLMGLQQPGNAPSDQPIHPELVKLHFSIASVFKIFDSEDRNQVEVSELGTIVRGLGCCPSEEDLRDIILECEEEESTGYIKYERFEPVMTRILKQRKYMSASVDELVEAYKVLDEKGDGFLDPDVFAELLTSKGEMFSEEEVHEMFGTAVDIHENRLYYEEHAIITALDENLYLVKD